MEIVFSLLTPWQNTLQNQFKEGRICLIYVMNSYSLDCKKFIIIIDLMAMGAYGSCSDQEADKKAENAQ